MALDDYRHVRRRPDLLLAIFSISLVAFGMTMILSASEFLAGSSGDIWIFVRRQAISFALGLVGLLIAASLDYRIWKKWAGPIGIGVMVLLLAVFISPTCRGVHRCIDLGPIQFQPAEFVKIGFLVYLAAWLAQLGSRVKDFKEGFLAFAGLIAVVGGLVILQPDMGTTMSLVLASVIVYFLAGAAWHHLGFGVMVGLGLAIVLILIAPYRLERAKTFLNPAADPQGAGYQTNQIETAIGSGGLWGLGFGQGKLKYLGYVPEVHTDSIFAVVVEELGFIRSMIILGVLFYVIFRGYRVAREAPDQFGRLLAGGLTSLLAVQTFINLSAMVGFIPLTGIPLPFISYGGSSLVTSMAAIGIILGISRASVSKTG